HLTGRFRRRPSGALQLRRIAAGLFVRDEPLTWRRAAEVIAIAGVPPTVSERAGATRHRLRLARFDLILHARSRRQHAAHVSCQRSRLRDAGTDEVYFDRDRRGTAAIRER